MKIILDISLKEEKQTAITSEPSPTVSVLLIILKSRRNMGIEEGIKEIAC
jgi:hypothetical protein